MEKNVGDFDSYIRLTGGLTLLGVGITKKSNMMIAFGAMKVAEGITRFCPALYLLGLSTNDKSITLNIKKSNSTTNKENNNTNVTVDTET